MISECFILIDSYEGIELFECIFLDLPQLPVLSS